MPKVIYVFSEIDRDTLLSNQYLLLKSDDRSHVYIFAAKEQERFDFGQMKYVVSNILTF